MFPKEQQIHHPNKKQSNQQDEDAMKHSPQDLNDQPHCLGESFEHHAFDETRRSFFKGEGEFLLIGENERKRARDRTKERKSDLQWSLQILWR